MSHLARIASVAESLWRRGELLRAALGVGPEFPHRIALPQPRGVALLENFAGQRDAIERLQAASVAAPGFAIEYDEVASRTAGAQRLPCAAVFAAPEDLAAFAGHAETWRAFATLVPRVLGAHPELRDWLVQRPFDALDCAPEWSRVDAVLRHFRAHPRPGVHVRQLDIRGVDTKFVERRRALLRELLDRVLPPAAIDTAADTLAAGGFERRYGLAYDAPSWRLRILDPALCPWPGVSDVALPPAQLANLSLPVERVFVVENKLNALTLPPSDGALVLFGQGYRACALGEVPWLRRVALHYWGDLDTHGYSILDRLRATLPHARSLLMDERTLVDHRELWTTESPSRRVVDELPHLTDAEAALYRDLRDQRYGANVRLEQERVGHAYAQAAVAALGR